MHAIRIAIYKARLLGVFGAACQFHEPLDTERAVRSLNLQTQGICEPALPGCSTALITWVVVLSGSLSPATVRTNYSLSAYRTRFLGHTFALRGTSWSAHSEVDQKF